MEEFGRNPHRRAMVLVLLLAGLAMGPAPAFAQDSRTVPQEPDPDRKTARVVAGPRYEAGSLKRFFFGDGYRDLWTVPIEVPVLDMERVGGGLRGAFEVGGAQTKGLAIAGADGRSYTFRAVDKDPSSILPPELRGTPFEELVRDQISSSFPGAPLVANPLAHAVGVPQTDARLVVLPDDPRLGEFREEYAGLFGTFEEYPTAGPDGEPGTFGAVELLDGRDLFARITAGWETRVDKDAYLRARLLDLVLGDWDRHIEQWRFARFADREGWVPIPEDRDQALSRYDGAVMWATRDREPKFDVFGPRYTPLEGLTWNARTVDRRLLAGVERSDYERIGREVQEALTDEVIADAVRNLPEPYHAIRGAEIERWLLARRDDLVEEAHRYYDFLAREVDIRTTNEAELVRIDRTEEELHVVVLPLQGQVAGGCDVSFRESEPVFERRFLSSETREVRIYLGAGADRVVLNARGSGRGESVAVRIVGGADDNLLCDTATGRSWSFGLRTPVDRGSGIELVEDLWISPGETIEEGGMPAEQQGPAAIAQRDWGSTSYGVPWVGAAPDIGLFLGGGMAWEDFGFRQRPYATRHQLRLGFAFGAQQPRLDYEGRYHFENRRAYVRLRALASGIETINFFGFGNETVGEEEEFFRVEQRAFALRPRVFLPIGQDGWLSTGPVLRYTVTDTDEDRFISRTRPFGVESTGQVGWVMGASFSNREFPGARDIKPTDDLRRLDQPDIGPGVAFDIDATYYPEIWGIEDDYGKVQGAFSGWLHFGQFAPALGFQVGGQRNFGEAPYYDSAFLGGRELRGFDVSRFAGDSSAYGNVALLLSLADFTIVVPGRIGVIAHAGTGRVWEDLEESDTWHWSYGGGIWWAPWTMQTALRVGVAETDQGFELYVVTGFGF